MPMQSIHIQERLKMFMHVSIYQSICLSIWLSVDSSVYLSTMCRSVFEPSQFFKQHLSNSLELQVQVEGAYGKVAVPRAHLAQGVWLQRR